MKKITKLIFRYDLINNYLYKNKITKKQLCEKCKFSLSTLYKFYHGKSVFVESMLKLVNVLGVKVYEFWLGGERKQ